MSATSISTDGRARRSATISTAGSGRHWRRGAVGVMRDADRETETGRFEARDAIAALLARWCASKTLAEIREAFAGSGVLWEAFQDFIGLVRDDPRCSPANPLFANIEQPGIGRYPMRSEEHTSELQSLAYF